MSYRQFQDGEWLAPVRRGHRVQCCDCGLVHVVDFRMKNVGGGMQIQYRATRVKRKGRK